MNARGVSMKTVSLVLLVVQTTSLVLSIKYSTLHAGPRYLASTAVFWMEVVKLGCALLVVFYQKRASVTDFTTCLRQEVGSFSELVKLSVPSFLYTVQNNLLYLAIANLDAPTYQVTYNAKILTTGLFAVLLLGRRLSVIQWASLVLLVVGVSFAQYVPGAAAAVSAASAALPGATSKALGLAAVAIACVTSGFSGVYFEKVLKSSATSLWVRNIQMSLSSVPLALLSVWWTDGDKVAANGFNYGYNWIVWQIVFNQAGADLLLLFFVFSNQTVSRRIACGCRDQIRRQCCKRCESSIVPPPPFDLSLKAFAAAISIISSALFSAFFFDFVISPYFVIGATLVLAATYVYSVPEAANPFVPSFMRELPKAPALPI